MQSNNQEMSSSEKSYSEPNYLFNNRVFDPLKFSEIFDIVSSSDGNTIKDVLRKYENVLTKDEKEFIDYAVKFRALTTVAHKLQQVGDTLINQESNQGSERARSDLQISGYTSVFRSDAIRHSNILSHQHYTENETKTKAKQYIQDENISTAPNSSFFDRILNIFSFCGNCESVTHIEGESILITNTVDNTQMKTNECSYNAQKSIPEEFEENKNDNSLFDN